VKEVILDLIKLQALDDKIKLWRKTAEEGPAKLAEARLRLSALESGIASRTAALAQNRSRRRELEAETADLGERRKTNQSRLLKARNNDEYRAILKEGETIATMISTREDEILLLMDSGEKLEDSLKTLTADARTEAADYEARSKEIESAIGEGRRNAAAAEAERVGMLAAIPPEILGRYATVARNRAGQAMSPVRDGQCQACRLSIPPQMFNELQRTDKIMVCPNCARIMYWVKEPHFREFLGEPAEDPKPAPVQPEAPRRGRKPKPKPQAGPEMEADSPPPVDDAEDDPDASGEALP
jgi:predicted  nucleic acid-binding Zn-ribbon protein